MPSLKTSLAFCALLLAGCSSESAETLDHGSSKSDLEVAQPVVERRVSNPFPDATELRLFVETAYDQKTGKAIFSRSNGIRLSEPQRRKFEDALKIEAAPEEMAACFIPHHFFRYFDAEGKQVGEVEVCFCCSGVAASGSPKLQASNGEMLGADYSEVESVVASVGEPTDVLCD